MLLAFFDNKGVIYSHIVPKGSPVNCKYIVKALGNFLKQLKKKRPLMVKQEWWFQWDNAPVHTAAVIQHWFVANSIQWLEHPPYLPDPRSSGLLPVQKGQGGAGRPIPGPGDPEDDLGMGRPKHAAEEFPTAFRRWYERCKIAFESTADTWRKHKK
jgi:hypothetical protein